MNRFYIVLAISISFCLFNCKSFIPSSLIPYDMVKLEEGLFIDKTEITVEQYAEFILDDNHDHKPKAEFSKEFRYHFLFYPTSTPDSLYKALGKFDYYNLPVVHEYFDTLNYGQLREILDFPITGISPLDAEAFCKWRTDKHNEQYSDHTKSKIEYYLPDYKRLKNSNEEPLDANKFTPKDIYTVRSPKHSQINNKGIFGLNSNVNEFSFNSSSKASNNIGYRCIGQILE